MEKTGRVWMNERIEHDESWKMLKFSAGTIPINFHHYDFQRVLCVKIEIFASFFPASSFGFFSLFVCVFFRFFCMLFFGNFRPFFVRKQKFFCRSCMTRSCTEHTHTYIYSHTCYYFLAFQCWNLRYYSQRRCTQQAVTFHLVEIFTSILSK